MVLEEHLLFYDEDDADTFIKFLREKNCRVQKSTESAIIDDTLLIGKLGNMIRLVEKLDEVGTPDHSGCGCGDECEGHESPYADMLENLTALRSRIDGIMTKFGPGDVIYSRDDLEQKKKEIAACLETGSEEDQYTLIQNELLLQGCLHTLDQNELSEETPEGIVLRKKAAPDDLIIERRAEAADEIDPELPKSHDVTLTHRVTFGTAVRIATEPRLYFTCEPEELEKLLVDMDIDEVTLETFLHNQLLKGLAIEKVMKTIEDKGKMALPELISEMESVETENGDEDIPLGLAFSPAFITCLVNDLRKVGALEGNDRKIRIVK
ncbi:MAG: hypothetical protein ABFC24_03325 [Methanoregulaceae archaeon]